MDKNISHDATRAPSVTDDKELSTLTTNGRLSRDTYAWLNPSRGTAWHICIYALNPAMTRPKHPCIGVVTSEVEPKMSSLVFQAEPCPVSHGEAMGPACCVLAPMAESRRKHSSALMRFVAVLYIRASSSTTAYTCDFDTLTDIHQ